MMVTRGMPDLDAATGAPIDDLEVLSLLLMAFFLSPSRVRLVSVATWIASFDTYLMIVAK